MKITQAVLAFASAMPLLAVNASAETLMVDNEKRPNGLFSYVHKSYVLAHMSLSISATSFTALNSSTPPPWFLKIASR